MHDQRTNVSNFNPDAYTQPTSNDLVIHRLLFITGLKSYKKKLVQEFT